MASGNSLIAFTPQANEPPSAAFATLDLRNQIPVLDFDDSTDEEAVFTGVLPRHYSGSGLTVALHLMFTGATSGVARFQVAFERRQAGVTDLDADSFASFQSAAATAPATNGTPVVLEIPFTSGAQMDSLAAGESFRLKVRRDADATTGTDSVSGDAELFAVEIRET